MMNKKEAAIRILKILKKEYPRYPKPVSTYFQESTNNPFKVLISTVLSPRAKDSQTEKVSKELFKIADTPEKLVNLTDKQLQKVIYSIGFYKEKSKRVKQASEYLLDHYGGNVPDRLEDLLKIPGVGRKVANIVLAECFGKPAIAIDIHCFRVPNRIGIIKTKDPLGTEKALMKLYPIKEWKNINRYFVVHGQNVCLPLSPKCSACKIEGLCQKVGVKNK